jgi:hypothetical protein
MRAAPGCLALTGLGKGWAEASSNGFGLRVGAGERRTAVDLGFADIMRCASDNGIGSGDGDTGAAATSSNFVSGLGCAGEATSGVCGTGHSAADEWVAVGSDGVTDRLGRVGVGKILADVGAFSLFSAWAGAACSGCENAIAS